jgi:peptidoglycan hydrolase-like protein with peptidoglycan-binding domain
LSVFARTEGSNDWSNETTCFITQGKCTFQTNHATTFAAREAVIETNENIGDTDSSENINDTQKAYIRSWKAYQYENTNGGSCDTKMKVTIKGRHFSNKAKVEIGGKEASLVNVKNSRNLTATFCLSKMLNSKTALKRIISVKNINAKIAKAKKKINLRTIGFKPGSLELNASSTDGIKDIQRALFSLEYLKKPYKAGKFDSDTQAAIITFQKKNNIPATGYFGILTKAKLEQKIISS